MTYFGPVEQLSTRFLFVPQYCAGQGRPAADSAPRKYQDLEQEQADLLLAATVECVSKGRCIQYRQTGMQVFEEGIEKGVADGFAGDRKGIDSP